MLQELQTRLDKLNKLHTALTAEAKTSLTALSNNSEFQKKFESDFGDVEQWLTNKSSEVNKGCEFEPLKAYDVEKKVARMKKDLHEVSEFEESKISQVLNKKKWKEVKITQVFETIVDFILFPLLFETSYPWIFKDILKKKFYVIIQVKLGIIIIIITTSTIIIMIIQVKLGIIILIITTSFIIIMFIQVKLGIINLQKSGDETMKKQTEAYTATITTLLSSLKAPVKPDTKGTFI